MTSSLGSLNTFSEHLLLLRIYSFSPPRSYGCDTSEVSFVAAGIVVTGGVFLVLFGEVDGGEESLLFVEVEGVLHGFMER